MPSPTLLDRHDKIGLACNADPFVRQFRHRDNSQALGPDPYSQRHPHPSDASPYPYQPTTSSSAPWGTAAPTTQTPQSLARESKLRAAGLAKNVIKAWGQNSAIAARCQAEANGGRHRHDRRRGRKKSEKWYAPICRSAFSSVLGPWQHCIRASASGKKTRDTQ